LGIEEAEPSRRQLPGQFKELPVRTMDANLNDIVEGDTPVTENASRMPPLVGFVKSMDDDSETGRSCLEKRQSVLR
jgi:hypothetical protein